MMTRASTGATRDAVDAVRTGLGRNLRNTAMAAADAAGLCVEAAPGPPVTDADLRGLPAQAVRYLRAMGVVGRERDHVLTVHTHGRFRMGRRSPWLPYEAWQVNTDGPIARIYHLRVDVGPVPMIASDTYLNGHGAMRGAVLGLVPVVERSGTEMDISELVTWLNDAVLFAPTMLLRDGVQWAALDDCSFGITLTDHDVQVTARVVLNRDGTPRRFETFDRYVDLGAGFERARWSTPVCGWQTVDGVPQFSGGTAVWELPGDDFAYARTRLRPGDVTRGPLHRRW